MCDMNVYYCDKCGKYLFTGTVDENEDCFYDHKQESHIRVSKGKYLCMDCFQMDMLTEYEDDALRDWYSAARRPYYRLIGKPVTEAQALEIIARTDRFWTSVVYLENDELYRKVEDKFIHIFTPMNAYWFYNLLPSQHGFVKPNGNVYGDGITDKYPEADELAAELLYLAQVFPFLDFVMAVTIWDEIPHSIWEDENLSLPHEPWEMPTLWKNFHSVIDIAFHVCNGRVKVLSKETGQKLYREYEDNYLDKSDLTFYHGYAHKNRILTCDETYMKKMFDYYNLEGEEVEAYLSRTKEYYNKW